MTEHWHDGEISLQLSFLQVNYYWYYKLLLMLLLIFSTEFFFHIVTPWQGFYYLLVKKLWNFVLVTKIWPSEKLLLTNITGKIYTNKGDWMQYISRISVISTKQIQSRILVQEKISGNYPLYQNTFWALFIRNPFSCWELLLNYFKHTLNWRRCLRLFKIK